jgi:hypothetical protein
MQPLMIEPSDETPKVILDKGGAKFEISGRSLPEDSAGFFEPILQWIKQYTKEPNLTTEFVFKLDYSNTASSKFVHEILVLLQSVPEVKVVWWYQKDDEGMMETGAEFAEQVDIPFDVRPYV